MEDAKEVVNENKVDNEEINQQQVESNLNLEQFLEILKNGDNEITKYYHSTIDSQVNKRLEKRIKAYEEQQKIKAEEEQKAKAEEKKIKQYEREIEDLKKELEYRKVLESYNLPSELSKFVADENKEKTIENIEFFLQVMDKYANEKIKEKLTENPPIPEKSEGEKSNKKNKLWNI